MDVGAIDALIKANLEVDRALSAADETLHRLQVEVPLESEAVTKGHRTQEHQGQVSLQ